MSTKTTNINPNILFIIQFNISIARSFQRHPNLVLFIYGDSNFQDNRKITLGFSTQSPAQSECVYYNGAF